VKGNDLVLRAARTSAERRCGPGVAPRTFMWAALGSDGFGWPGRVWCRSRRRLRRSYLLSPASVLLEGPFSW